MKKALLDFLRRHWALLALVGFAGALRGQLLLGVVPATGDHMIHLYKGWLMAEHLLPSGRLTGWTHLSFAGYPAGVYYPIVGDLYVALFRYLTLGLLSWERTYALAFFFVVLFIPVAVYLLARRAAGPTGSLAAGLFATGDIGGWPQGGHVTTVYWAVWPFALALSLALVSLPAFERTLGTPLREKPGITISFALLLGLCVIAHPMNVTFLAVAAPLFVLAFVLFGRGAHRLRHVAARAALAAGVAFVLSAFWIVPWLAGGRDWTLGWPCVGFGGRWLSLFDMLDELVRGELFHEFWTVPLVLGGVGLLAGLASRRLWPTYLAVLLILLFAATGLAHDLHDGIIARKVQIERMAAYLKSLWFILAGYAVDRAGALTLLGVERLPAAWRAGRRGVALGVAKGIAGPILAAGIVVAGWSCCFSPARLIGDLGGELWKDICQAETWLGSLPHGPLDRVLYQPGKLCTSGKLSSMECNEVYHRHLFASGPLRTGLPKIKFGYEATAIFRNLPLAHRWPMDSEFIKRFLTEPDALRNLHVRWIVSLVPWPERADLTLARRFGKVWVYSVKWGEEPPARVTGEGRAEVLRFDDEELAVRVEGAAPDSRLRFPVAYFYPWHAYHDGRPLKIERAGILPGVRQILITTPALDGITVLRYERPVFERVANWASVLGLAGCLAFLAWRLVSRRHRARA